MLSEQSLPDSRRLPADQSRERGRDVSSWNRVRTLLGLPSSQDESVVAVGLKFPPRATSFEESLPSDQTEHAPRLVDVSRQQEQIEESGATRSDLSIRERRPTQQDGGGHRHIGRQHEDVQSSTSRSRASRADTDTAAAAARPLSQDQPSERSATTPAGMPSSQERDVHVAHTAHDVDPQRRLPGTVVHSDGPGDRTPGAMLSGRRQGLATDEIHDAAVARLLTTSARFATDRFGLETPERVANEQDLSERLERLRRTVRNLEAAVASQVVRNRERQPYRRDHPSSSPRVVVVASMDTSSTATRAFWERRRLGHLSLRSGR